MAYPYDDEQQDDGSTQAPLVPDSIAPIQAPFAAPISLPPAPMPDAPAPTPDAPAPTGGFQMPPRYPMQIASTESGNDPTARNPNSSAGGRYQITDPTMQSVIARHPELAGADKNDPRVLQALTADNNAILTKTLGRTPTPVDLVAAHFLGADGATHFLHSKPDQPAYTAVSQDAVDANRGVFFKADGSPRTVAELYAMEAQKVGGSPEMPKFDGNFATPYANSATGGQGRGTGYGDATPGNPYGQQGQDIARYIQGQPAMWDKLQKMQDEYKQSRQPSYWDKLGDVMTQMQMQQAAADANRHATAGGIIFHELPNAQPFINTLEKSHDIDMADRNQRRDDAKSAYEMGSSTLAAQNAQQLSNLGLTGSLAKDTATYGQTGRGLDIQQQQANTESQKVANDMQIKMMEYGTAQQAALQKTVTEMLPMASQQNEAWKRFFAAGGDPRASSSDNVKSMTQIVNDIRNGRESTISTAGTSPASAPASGPSQVAIPTSPAPDAAPAAPAAAPAISLPRDTQLAGIPAPVSDTPVPLLGAGPAANAPPPIAPVAPPPGQQPAPQPPQVQPQQPGPPPAQANPATRIPGTLSPSEYPPTNTVNINKPGKEYQVFYYDAKGEPTTVNINENDEAGMAWLRQPHPSSVRVLDPSAPQNTINNNSGGGDVSGSGGGTGASIDKLRTQATKTANAADTVLQLLPYLQEHGGTGVLTESSLGQAATSALNQLGIPVAGATVRQVYEKLMNQIQLGLVLPSLKEFGARPAQTEFQALMKGQMPSSATIPAVQAYVTFVKESAQYDRTKLLAEAQERQASVRRNDPSWSRDVWSMQYEDDHPPPTFHADDLIDAANKANPNNPVGAVKDAPTAVQHGFGDWLRNWVPGGTPSTPSPPAATPAQPPLNMTPEQQRLFQGGQ